jgi:hypothetical protein
MVALDLLYWAMGSAPYRLIRMAIEMASEVAAFFLLLIIHNSSHYKLTASYTIVHYNVIS